MKELHLLWVLFLVTSFFMVILDGVTMLGASRSNQEEEK